MPTSIDMIPHGDVFYPTEEEFRNFRAYITKIALSPQYANASLVKVK